MNTIEIYTNTKRREKVFNRSFNTVFRYIKPGEKSNNIRLESFRKLSPNIKEALVCIGEVFKNANLIYPWAIHGSTALVLEGETSKKPTDIDFAFGQPDLERVLAEFKKLEQKGLARNLKTEEMRNFQNKKNGCIKIAVEIKTGKTPKGFWIETEAFAQNVDPNKPCNGITNIGLERTGVNIYEINGVEINFVDQNENFRFYLQIAYIELQKYRTENFFLYKLKNKFPQRINNLIAIIKRQKIEKFERKLKKGKTIRGKKSKTGYITDEEINELITKFIRYNSQIKTKKITDFSHLNIDPIEIIQTELSEFRNEQNNENNAKNKGFVYQKIKKMGLNLQYAREHAIDELTFENLKDMQDIANSYMKLMTLREKLKKLNTLCKSTENRDKETVSKITETMDTIFIKTGGLLKLFNNILNKYKKYLFMINHADNRDFFAYIAIRQTLNGYIIPFFSLLRVAIIVMQSEVEKNWKILETINR